MLVCVIHQSIITFLLHTECVSLCTLTYCATFLCSCGDGTLGVPNQRGDNYECRNMKLLLKQQQRVITLYCFFAFFLTQVFKLSARFLLLVLLHSVEVYLAHDYNNFNTVYIINCSW